MRWSARASARCRTPTSSSTSELQDARIELEEKETALRTFKEAHMGQLPEQVQANLSTLQRLQLEQQATTDSLRKATDTRC